ncbi:hypothetical protein [Halobellus ruber]|uniref:DUF8165 domain-containing protein n=1 Tax=Halobellus ruber TaxID=2761102 RepID=A0A7J9SFW4_9EURY|nr:hypothetical protein [Halobellus ruber]MBB6644886.1 hypothetical protein [Halobellus ruber]
MSQTDTDTESDLTALPHLYTVHDSIPYGVAARIRNHDAVPGNAIAEGAAAYHRYLETSDEEIVAVHPDGFATAVHLGSMTMATVSLDAAPQDVLTAVADEIDLESYSLLVFGRPSRTPDHSIQEYI